MNYSFEPKPDITVTELAEILKTLGINAKQSGIDKLKPDTRRHFERELLLRPGGA